VEWVKLREEEKIRNEMKDHKEDVAEEREKTKEIGGNKIGVDKKKEKGQEEETRNREKEERGKKEFWEMIKKQKERKKQKRIEIRKKVMRNEKLTKKKINIWMEKGRGDNEKEEL
jgi:hypothetical protein